MVLLLRRNRQKPPLRAAEDASVVTKQKGKKQMPASRFKTARREWCVFFPFSASSSSDLDFRPQPHSIHILLEFVRANSIESHRSEKSHINIKTNGFKPRRDTYLQHAFSQLLCNHIFLQIEGWGRGGTGSSTATNSDTMGNHFQDTEHVPPVTSAWCESRLLSGQITSHLKTRHLQAPCPSAIIVCSRQGNH